MNNALAMLMPRPDQIGVDPTRRSPIPGAASVPTAVAPAPMQAPQPVANALAKPMASPYAPPQPKQQNALLGAAIDGFRRGFDPQGRQADMDQRKADGTEKAKQTLALMQQQRALPAEQRAQWWTQNAPQIGQIIGQDLSAQRVDPNAFTDEAMDGQIAMLSGKLGIAPEQAEYMNLGGGAVGKTQNGQFTMAREAAVEPPKPTIVNNRVIDPNDPTKVLADYSDPAKPAGLPEGMWYGPDGKGPPQPIPGYVSMRTQIAQGSQNAGSGKRTVNLTPAEVAARGYPVGTVVQRDEEGNELVRSRPSTQQTGQPTESERSAGLHATVSINGLRNIMAREAGGYNRAGVMEQAGGIVGGENERLYDQAADEFIDGYLRAMTGAAATKNEIDTYKRQWFPTLGDTPAVIAQKSAGRLNALKGMKSKAGRAWNPEWDAMIAQLESQAGGGGQQGPAMNGAASVAGLAAQAINNQPAAVPEDDDTFIDSLFPADGGELPAGVTQEEWDVMTPEEQALFQ